MQYVASLLIKFLKLAVKLVTSVQGIAHLFEHVTDVTNVTHAEEQALVLLKKRVQVSASGWFIG